MTPSVPTSLARRIRVAVAPSILGMARSMSTRWYDASLLFPSISASASLPLPRD